jgi:SagB-type dehydrogenase family enzyme
MVVTGMMRSFHAVLVLAAVAQWLAACAPTTALDAPPDTQEGTLELPPPARAPGMALDEALSRRRSVREYDVRPLTPAEIGQLLWAAQGITSEQGFRTAPSAGALYPLELYLLTAEGVFRYEPQHHRLALVGSDDARNALYQAALQQEPVRSAPAVFVLAAVYTRTSRKYGEVRSPRYVHMEAGHAAQNLLLEATALGLGAVPIGAFDDRQVQEALGLPADHRPLYLIPTGHPSEPGP